MPTKHVVKVYAANHYYHVFNRGWNLSKIFTDEKDFLFFEHLLARHLGTEVVANATSKPYKNYLNHNKFTSWSHSSYKDYMVNTREWIKPNPILELFGDTIAYETFVNDYADLQRERDAIKHELFRRSA